MFEDGTCLTGTLAILKCLADRHPESGLAPAPGSPARARLDQWMSFALVNIYEGELSKNYPHRWVVGDVWAVEAAAEAFVLENYRLLEAACSEGPYFFGTSPTILDFYLWMFISWFDDFEDPRSACPRLHVVADAVMHRPVIDAVHRYDFGEGPGGSPPGAEGAETKRVAAGVWAAQGRASARVRGWQPAEQTLHRQRLTRPRLLGLESRMARGARRGVFWKALGVTEPAGQGQSGRRCERSYVGDGMDVPDIEEREAVEARRPCVSRLPLG